MNIIKTNYLLHIYNGRYSIHLITEVNKNLNVDVHIILSVLCRVYNYNSQIVLL